ncbi:MAG: S1-C subfamily serine protease [Patiriisocius sp.]|jgi:S1-C subfamily serine protease
MLTDIAISIITAYLALTNSLATQIENIFSVDPVQSPVTAQEESPTLTHLSSAYDAIPNVLLENSAYQRAALIDTQLDVTTSATSLEALVNIYCTYTTDEYTRATTGTGYFIHTDGIILTNAHVAQFLLLEGVAGDTECIIRTGDPAVPTYEADLLYISPAWVQKHAELISQENPQGTGERDYALLYVTSGIDNNPMPRDFPAISIDVDLLTTDAIDDTVFAAGYPAAKIFAAGDGTSDLLPKQAETSVTELMTFGSNYADIFSIAGSTVGQQGSSGGPIVNAAGNAIGLISTRGDDALFGEGSLRAISLSYIDRTIQQETGYTLQQNLSGNLPYRARIFKEALVPFLRDMLTRELET